MDEQKQHLSNLLQQKQSLQNEIEQLKIALEQRKELYLRVQGAIEYLTQIGVANTQDKKED